MACCGLQRIRIGGWRDRSWKGQWSLACHEKFGTFNCEGWIILKSFEVEHNRNQFLFQNFPRVGESTGNIPVGNSRGSGRVSSWGLNEHRAAKVRGAVLTEQELEGLRTPGRQGEGKERQVQDNWMGFYLVRMDAGAIISVWVPRTRLFGGRVGLEILSSVRVIWILRRPIQQVATWVGSREDPFKLEMEAQL